MTILALNQYYLPGYKAGGPIRTLANMVERMGDEFRFKIIAGDRDSGDVAPYPSARPGEWQAVGKAEVYYLAPSQRSIWTIRRLLRSVDYDVLYLNSFFSFWYTIVPLGLLRLGLIPRRPVVVAPRGEFSPGALSIKRAKKKTFIVLARSMGLYRGVLWQASSDLEAEDIRHWMGRTARIKVAPNIPDRMDIEEVLRRQGKEPGRLRAVFLSRITEKKNLLWALDLLRSIRGKVEFDIYGSVADPIYWEKCCKIIAEMPANVRVRYKGVAPHEMVRSIFSEYDAFLFPTLGENFGHVVLEALSAGCPVVMSDTTPWRDLEARGVGWVLPLTDRSAFVEVLERLVDMDEAEHARWRDRARRFGVDCMDASDTIVANEDLFRSAVFDQ